MSQPPYPPQPQEPYSGQPGSAAPQGYPPPPPPAGYGAPARPDFAASPPPPGYGPPGQPGYGVPQYGAPAPKKKSSTLKIVLIVVSVIAVLCVGGVAVTLFAARDTVGKVVDAASITVVQPATLGGRAKVTDPNLSTSLLPLNNELQKVPGATATVTGLYGDVQEQDLVMVAAASSITGSPQERFDEFTSGMTSEGMQLTNFTDTDPGPLGGIAKCGDSDAGEVDMAICVWSDNGSIGMFAMLFKKKADLVKEFVAMRGQVEQKK
jgi:hypothetical protein